MDNAAKSYICQINTQATLAGIRPFALSETRSAELWQQFRAGSADAFGQLADAYYKDLYNYGLRFSTDSDFVRDCLQDVLVDLWSHRQSLSVTDQVKPYLLKALRNRLLKELQRQKRGQQLEELAFLDHQPEPSAEAVLVQTEQQTAQLERLNRLLAQLPPREMEIIYLRFYQGLEHEAIAHVMNVGRSSVATLLHRALKNLRDDWFDSSLPLWLALINYYK